MTKSAGHHRKEVYGVIQEIIGRDLTEKEHKFLRAMLIAYTTDVAVVRQVKVEYTCKECRSKREVSKNEHGHFMTPGHPGGAKVVSDTKEFFPPLDELE